MKLTLATCQFPVDSDIRRNTTYVLSQMRTAKKRGADVAHFPEACLSGYAGTDFESFEGFDWHLLKECTQKVLHLSRILKLWVILGSTHRLTGKHKPHNSLYIINSPGKIIDRYDKMFCAGDSSGKTGDLARYSPGNHFCVFTVKGVRCGTLICHEYRYPELYRKYKRKGVQLMFHSYHAGHITPERMKTMEAEVGAEFQKLNKGSTLPAITMPAAMHAAAADNYMWISCSNTSARESCWPGFFVRPDGVVTGRLRLHITGILITEVNTAEKFYDSTAAWRDRAMRGVFHSGTLVHDRRSEVRTEL
jgi:predicted amidohydrolase